MTYVPEQDGGESAAGQAILSADMWIPIERYRNPDAILRMGELHSTATRGDVKTVNLVRREKHHMVFARHLHDDWSARVPEWTTPALEEQWERVDFGAQIELRDEDQEAAWAALLPANNGILNLGCGKGKTVLALKKIADRGFPAIVLVNNTGLITQWLDRIRQFLGLREDQIGVVHGAREEWDRPLVVGMIHTIAKRSQGLPMETRQRFGTIVFDEAHHLPAVTFLKTAPLFFGARFGLTATLEREDGLEPAYYAHLGGAFHRDLRGDLTADIYFKSTHFSLPKDAEEMTDKTGEFSVGKLYTYLSTVEERNRMIAQDTHNALLAGRKVLVLSHSKDHPEILRDMLEEMHPGRWVIGAVAGKIKGNKRVKIIEDSDVTFATAQVAREGLDVPSLDTLFLVTPFKAWGGMQQGKGRIERQYPGKQDPIVMILDDRGIGPARAMCLSLRSSLREHGFGHTNVRT